jgi:hypothetical protein
MHRRLEVKLIKNKALLGGLVTSMLLSSAARSDGLDETDFSDQARQLQAELVSAYPAAVAKYDIRAEVSDVSDSSLVTHLIWTNPDGSRRIGPELHHSIIDHTDIRALYPHAVWALMQYSGLPSLNPIQD